jgi:hypothetical protein
LEVGFKKFTNLLKYLFVGVFPNEPTVQTFNIHDGHIKVRIVDDLENAGVFKINGAKRRSHGLWF